LLCPSSGFIFREPNRTVNASDVWLRRLLFLSWMHVRLAPQTDRDKELTTQMYFCRAFWTCFASHAFFRKSQWLYMVRDIDNSKAPAYTARVTWICRYTETQIFLFIETI
jgi:hypothetical protein